MNLSIYSLVSYFYLTPKCVVTTVFSLYLSLLSINELKIECVFLTYRYPLSFLSFPKKHS